MNTKNIIVRSIDIGTGVTNNEVKANELVARLHRYGVPSAKVYRYPKRPHMPSFQAVGVLVDEQEWAKYEVMENPEKTTSIPPEKVYQPSGVYSHLFMRVLGVAVCYYSGYDDHFGLKIEKNYDLSDLRYSLSSHLRFAFSHLFSHRQNFDLIAKRYFPLYEAKLFMEPSRYAIIYRFDDEDTANQKVAMFKAHVPSVQVDFCPNELGLPPYEVRADDSEWTAYIMSLESYFNS